MLRKHEGENLEKTKRELTNDLAFHLRRMVPIQIVTFVAVIYVCVAYFNESFSVFQIVGLVLVFCFNIFPLDLYRLWQVNRKLRRPHMKTLN